MHHWIVNCIQTILFQFEKHISGKLAYVAGAIPSINSDHFNGNICLTAILDAEIVKFKGIS